MKDTANNKIDIEEAAYEVKLACRRIALLYLSFAEELNKEMGKEAGKSLILKAVKNYGKKIGKEVKGKIKEKNLDLNASNFGKNNTRTLPKFGLNEDVKEFKIGDEWRLRVKGCVLAKVWEEYDMEELGKLYCFVDPAKYMEYNPDYKMIHLKNVLKGDEYCEFAIRETTEKERQDFDNEDSDWTHVDKYLNE